MLTIALLIVYSGVLVGYCFTIRPRADDYHDFVIGKSRNGPTVTAFGLFTLIGGGELVAGASLGFVNGLAGICLFLGYAVAFAALGFLGPRLRARSPDGSITYIDHAGKAYGTGAGMLILSIQVVAFFSLLVLQFSAGGVLLSRLLGVSHLAAVASCALVVTAYLVIAGFRAVAATDVIQGVVMLGMFALAAYILSSGKALQLMSAEVIGFDASWGMIISGIVIGLSSADVLQRVYAANSDHAVRTGFVLGGISLGVYGCLIVLLGMFAAAAKLTADPNEAFLAVVTGSLPPWVSALALVATFAAILSTADTELFLVSSLLDKYVLSRGLAGSDRTTEFRRWLIPSVAAAAVVGAYVGDDLATLFSWMFVAYMVVAPTIACTLFLRLSKAAVWASFLVTGLSFLGGLVSNVVTLDNAYWLALPAVLICIPAHMMKRQTP